MIMLFLGLTTYVFFAFTNIGNSNSFIKRARTAFHPSKDASMNVRLENREKIADYLSRNPLGAGIGHFATIIQFNECFHVHVLIADNKVNVFWLYFVK